MTSSRRSAPREQSGQAERQRDPYVGPGKFHRKRCLGGRGVIVPDDRRCGWGGAPCRPGGLAESERPVEAAVSETGIGIRRDDAETPKQAFCSRASAKVTAKPEEHAGHGDHALRRVVGRFALQVARRRDCAATRPALPCGRSKRRRRQARRRVRDTSPAAARRRRDCPLRDRSPPSGRTPAGVARDSRSWGGRWPMLLASKPTMKVGGPGDRRHTPLVTLVTDGSSADRLAVHRD